MERLASEGWILQQAVRSLEVEHILLCDLPFKTLDNCLCRTSQRRPALLPDLFIYLLHCRASPLAKLPLQDQTTYVLPTLTQLS